MNRMVFLCSSIFILLLAFSFVRGQTDVVDELSTPQGTSPGPNPETDPPIATSTPTTPAELTSNASTAIPTRAKTTIGSTDTNTTATTTITNIADTSNAGQPNTRTSTATTTNIAGSSNAGGPIRRVTTTAKSTQTSGSDSNPYNAGYGSGYNRGYDSSYNRVIGDSGVDPRKNGEDIGDYGPVTTNQRTMLSSLDLYIYGSEGSDQYNNKNKNNYGNRYNNNNYNKNRNSGYRNKRQYSQVRFPVKRIENYRNFPKKRFPSLISISPTVPIFYDKRTYQTIIFSPIGGIFIIPPLINFYGRRFAVAQLIKWGYASLVSSGAPVPAGVDVAPLVRPPPPGGVITPGVVGGTYNGPAPAYDPKKNEFNGGVKTYFREFRPRYSSVVEDEYSNRPRNVPDPPTPPPPPPPPPRGYQPQGYNRGGGYGY